MKIILSLLLFTGIGYAENITVAGPFSGLNNVDSSITLGVGESQDTLNVEVSKDLLALQKRQGYILTDTLNITTSPIYGSISFSDSGGNNYMVFAHDRFVSSSKNSAAYTNIVTAGTVGAEWKFCNASGKIYGFNTSHNVPMSYDGITVTYYSTMPYASLCAMTVDRMLLAGTTDFPNRLYFSQSGVLTNFTVGIEPEDPGFEDIGLAGEKITALFATETEWLIFKPHSMISYQGTNQFDLVPTIISDRVGVGDPNAIIQYEGIVYFKSSDGQIWGYASGQLTNLSKKIKNFTDLIVKSADNINYTTINTEAGWETYTNTEWADSSVKPIAYTNSDTVNAEFNYGTVGAPLVVEDDNVKLKSKIYFTNMDFETGLQTGWSPDSSYDSIVNSTESLFTVDFGTYALKAIPTNGTGVYCYSYISPYQGNSAGWVQYAGQVTDGTTYSNIDISTQADITYYVNFSRVNASNGQGATYYPTTGFLKGNGIIKTAIRRTSGACYFDIATQSASSGTFISQIHTTLSPNVNHPIEITWSGTEPTATAMSVRTSSSSTGVFSTWGTVSRHTQILSTATAYQYKAVLNNPNTGTDATVDNVFFISYSTGSVESPELYLGNFNTWGAFIADETKQTGSADHWTYQMKTSTYSGGTASASYSTVANNAIITISTGAYVRVKAINSFISTTETIKLNNLYFTDSYSTQHQSAGFEYLGDIYFSVPYANSTTNNRIMKFDINSGGWQIFDIPMNSPIMTGNDIYFGSVSGGYIYRYPYGNSDNGTAINSYWKTKNYIGNTNPYVEKQFQKTSLIAGSNSGSMLDVTYTMDTTTSTTYSISLSSSTGGFVRNNRALPIGERGTFFNLKVGNNAVNQPWSFYGASIDYTDDPWRVLPED